MLVGGAKVSGLTQQKVARLRFVVAQMRLVARQY